MNKKEFFENISDAELLRELRSENSEAALRVLVSRYQNSLMNFVYRFLGDKDSAKDIVQETFIRVYKKGDTYKEIAKFSTWLYSIASNLAKSELKKIRRQGKLPSATDNESEASITDRIRSSELLPEERLDLQMKEELIQSALLELPDHYREAVILRDVQELSYEEIAELLQAETGTVKSRINRGRALLRAMLIKVMKDE